MSRLPPVASAREVVSFADDWSTLLAQGGLFELSSWQTIVVRGPDTRDFLQRLSTWDARHADTARADRGALLTGRAHPVAMGWFLPGEREVRLVFPGPQGTRAVEHLEAMHFAENLSIALEPFAVFATAGAGLSRPSRPGLLSRVGEAWCWEDDIQPLSWSLVPEAQRPAWLAARGEPRIGHRVFDYLRLKDAIPEVGRELPSDAIVLEGNFEKPIARNKGCYPGQEVIERIFTYGQVNRRLYPIAWEAVRDLTTGLVLRAPEGVSAGKPWEGTVAAAERNPDGKGGIGLAWFPRAAWDFAGPWTAVTPEGETISVRRR